MPAVSFHLGFIGPGGPELLVVMLVLLMMFGAKDAPRILRKLNEIISQIRNAADGFKREIMYGDLDSHSSDSSTPDEDGVYGEYDYDHEDYDFDDSFDEDDPALEDVLAEDEVAPPPNEEDGNAREV